MATEPTILIAGQEQAAILPLLYGIEEEEIPFRWTTETTAQTAIGRAFEAAQMAQLNVGIGFDDEAAYLHHNSLPADKPLARVPLSDPADLRRLGANAARLVKRVPFKDFEKGGLIL
ncbi:glycerol dehydratase reactivase beta/small subunit family protein [Furfurilactobacillus sp. WILCCON 0119]|uniref:glycerol dehydratase reactivase beta/small subunit family protein n=1 Tax=Furfurilactobacillus entadae TaxID=2922307 RepID=UPI0035E8E6B6